MKQKFLKGLCITLGFMLLLAGCSKSKQGGGVLKLQSGDVNVKSIVKLDEKEIPFDMYRYWFLSIKASVEESSPDIDWTKKENIDSLKEQTLRQIKFIYAVRDIADRYKITLSQEQLLEIEENLKNDFKAAGSASEYKKQLSASFLTQELYEDLLTDGKLYETMAATLAGTDKEKNKLLFTTDEAVEGASEDFYRLADIYFVVETLDEDGNPLSDAQIEANKAAAKKKIDVAYNKLKSGKDFLEVMKEYRSDEEYESSLLRYYHAESMSETLGFDVKSLEIGEYSEPIYANNSYIILCRLENDSDHLKKLGVSIDGFNVFSVEEYYAEKVFGEMVEKTAAEYKVTELEFYDEINTQTLV
ncbi:MAG: peptidylprolyl isomerase [Oscillospiraceae bacterium]|nr:peptidylprolyl isomerase [Oscillospiraceae bacterium]